MITKISLIPEKNTISIHEHVRVDMVLDSAQQPVNAVSGLLRYDPAVLHVEAITTGSSMINFWVTAPAIGETAGVIEFSGIIPGGVTTADGQIFSVIFSGIKSGDAQMSVQNSEVYINDGQGTKTTVQSLPATMTVSKTVVEAKEYRPSDIVPPESFTLTRTRDPNIFDGQWFVVFGTQDKGSGIAHYKLCESFFRKCEQVKSPALLKSQSAFYSVRIKAYDQSGNVTTATLLSPSFIMIACILGAIIAILALYGVLKRKKIFFR